jgi:hypothetical protein
MKTRIGLVILMGFTAWLLAACTVQFGTQVNSGGGGQFRVEMSYTPEEAATLQGMGGDLPGGDLCGAMQAQLNTGTVPEGMEYYTEVRGEDTWCGFRLPFATLDELQQAYDDMGFVVNEMSLSDGNFVYDVSLEDMGTGDLGFVPIQLRWELTVPGIVGDNNADVVEGNTLTWNLATTGQNHLHAESSQPPTWVWWVIGLGLTCVAMLLVAATGAGVFFLVRRSMQSSAPAASLVE